MVMSCIDFSVIVRKMMIQGLTDLLNTYPDNALMVKAWVEGVFPLVTDNEVKCQEKAIEVEFSLLQNHFCLVLSGTVKIRHDLMFFFQAVSAVILENLVFHNQTANNMHLLPWKVINMLTLSEMRNVFRYVCRHWITTKRIG